jgi:hypothetical protein
MADGFSSFTTDGLSADGAGAAPPAATQPQRQAAGGAPAGAPQRRQQPGPALDPAARDALLLMFSDKGTYVQVRRPPWVSFLLARFSVALRPPDVAAGPPARPPSCSARTRQAQPWPPPARCAPPPPARQELLAEELVAAVDALSRDAAAQLLTGLLASAPAAAALGRLQALGPLRPLLLPLPTPLELLSRLAPAVALSPEDEEALSTVRGILALTQRLQPGGGSPAALLPSRESVEGAVRVAGELSPLLPQLAPGLAHTGELLVRALARRAARRVADAAGEVAAATAAAGGGGGAWGAAQQAPLPQQQQRPAAAFGFAPLEAEAGLLGSPSAAPGDGAAAAGQLLVGLAAAPLMLALAPLGILAQLQRGGSGGDRRG